MTDFAVTLERFRETMAGPADEVPLARAALLVAQAEHPDLEPDDYERRLEAIARDLEPRLALSDDPAVRLSAANSLIYGELGFRGDRDDYAEPRNLLLDDVIERRLGIPVTLAIVYVEVARRAGLDVKPVGLPGHVVARLDAPDGGEPYFIDVFHEGALLTPDACRALVREIYGRRTQFRDHFLEPVTSRQLIQRLLHNLKARALQRGEEERAARAIELLLALFPWDLDELRDRGMLHERLGDYPAALRDLEQYVRYRAGARDIDTVAEALRSLRRHVGAEGPSAD